MLNEWRQHSRVLEGGRIELTVPGLEPGQTVEVLVRTGPSSQAVERPLGILKGKIRMSGDFDAPLEEFDEYTR